MRQTHLRFQKFTSQAVRPGLAISLAASATVAGCAGRPSAEPVHVAKVPQREIFVLATGYRGPFLAVFAQPDGVMPEWRGDTAVYRVPPTGILKIALPEPPNSTKTSHVFADNRSAFIGNYPTCADMRVHVADALPRICWLDFWAGGTGIPDHIVAVVTDWNGIPANFNRTTFVYDSVLHGGRGMARREWTEPRDLSRRPPIRRTE
jgi:hypothetical protein